MSIRGNIANRFSGGPEYQVIPDRLLVEVQGQTSLSELVDRAGSETPDRPTAHTKRVYSLSKSFYL